MKTKTFKYITDFKDAYGGTELGLKKGDIFQLINTKLSYIEKDDTLSAYYYEYLINIPKVSCFVLDEESWSELIKYSEYVDSE